MKLGNLLSVHALVAAFFGVSLVVVPAPLISLYGMTLNPAGVFFAQVFGAAMIGYAVLNWFARSVVAPDALRAIVLANLVEDLVGFVIALLTQLAGLPNALGWSTVLIYLGFTLAYAYYQLVSPVNRARAV